MREFGREKQYFKGSEGNIKLFFGLVSDFFWLNITLRYAWPKARYLAPGHIYGVLFRNYIYLYVAYTGLMPGGVIYNVWYASCMAS